MEKFSFNKPIIITLDVDNLLFNKLQQINDFGFPYVEINTHDRNLLVRAKEEFPNITVGAGNILNTTQLETCFEANVKFVTSPGFLPEIVQTASIYSINYLPGIATISEAMQAMTLGCYNLRPLPAKLDFCSLLNKYFNNLKLFPAEVELEEIDHFLSLPSVNAVSLINPEQKQLQNLKAYVMNEG